MKLSLLGFLFIRLCTEVFFVGLLIRPDHNLQDLRAKVFPIKGRKAKASEVVSAVTLPVRRKERSLSSLVVSTPRVSTHATMTGRRTKGVTRKASALRGSSFSIEKPIKREEESADDHPESSGSPETSNKFSQNNRQVKEGIILFYILLLFMVIFLAADFLFVLTRLQDICFNLLRSFSFLTGTEFFSCRI